MHWLNSSQRSPGFFSLLVLLAVRGVRYLRRSNEEVQVGGILFDIFKPEVTGLNRGPKITPSVLQKKSRQISELFLLWPFICQETPKSVKVHTALIEDDEEEVGTATFGIVKGGWVHTGRRWSLFWRSPKIHRRCTCSKQSFDAQRFTYLSDAKNKGKGTV